MHNSRSTSPLSSTSSNVPPANNYPLAQKHPLIHTYLPAQKSSNSPAENINVISSQQGQTTSFDRNLNKPSIIDNLSSSISSSLNFQINTPTVPQTTIYTTSVPRIRSSNIYNKSLPFVNPLVVSSYQQQPLDHNQNQQHCLQQFPHSHNPQQQHCFGQANFDHQSPSEFVYQAPSYQFRPIYPEPPKNLIPYQQPSASFDYNPDFSQLKHEQEQSQLHVSQYQLYHSNHSNHPHYQQQPTDNRLRITSIHHLPLPTQSEQSRPQFQFCSSDCRCQNSFCNQLYVSQQLEERKQNIATAVRTAYYSQPPLPFHLQQTKPMSLQQQTTTTAIIEPGKSKLIWLLFMHRHGDRAPLNMAPRDKYNNISYWPEGFGNLNNAGRLRMYKVGQFIRKRYSSFLTDNIREVYSRSSDVDRCIESSHAVLAGLYPPSRRFEWNPSLPWIPAPVHSVPAPDDYLLNEGGKIFLMELINEIHIVQSSEAVKKLYEESTKERELLTRELGYVYDMFYKFKCTYSTLDIEERNGLEMPVWYTPELKQKLYRFAGVAFGLAGGGTEKLKRIRCGNLLDDILTRMEIAPISGPKMRDQSDFQQPTNAPSDAHDRKVIHYSTHDSIMAAFLEALNINTPTPIPPGFGATFFIELYVDVNELGLPVSERYMKLFYMDDTDSEIPIEKILPNCKLNEKGQLTLNNFKKYIGHLLPSGSSECNI